MNLAEPSQNVDIIPIEAAVARGDRNLAIDLAIRALGRDIEHPLVLNLVAEGLEEDGRSADAAGLLQRATKLAPYDAKSHSRFGRLALRLGGREEAMAAHQAALALAPDDVEVIMNAGEWRLSVGDVAAARAHYRRAVELSPTTAAALSAVAVTAANQGDAVEARVMGERAIALRPDLVSAVIAVARADLAERAPGEAKFRLERLLARDDLSDDQRAEALTYLADALDGLDRPAEAFALYDQRRELLTRARRSAMTAGAGHRALSHARMLGAYFEATPVSRWRDAAGDDRRGPMHAGGHVFMVGFPRSGTTLLEQVLGAHPSVVTLEEKAILAGAGDSFLKDEQALDQLAALDIAAADACRETYWRAATAALGEDVGGRVFIDKNPLNTLRLPLIAKFFPSSKVIFSVRDPRDVVLSGYRRLYYSTMTEFMTLEGSADLYGAVMGVADLYRSRLPVAIHDVRHEDLVTDFGGEVRRVLDFIGLAWDPSVTGFAARAAEVASPSAHQIAQGLTDRGLAQWRRYQRQLAPVASRLEPWARRYGYPPMPTSSESPEDGLPSTLAAIGAGVQAGDWQSVFAKVDEAFRAGLRHPLLHRLRGVRGQQEGRLEEAIADFEIALETTPGDSAVLSALGLCLAAHGRTGEGLARLDAAIAIQPRFAPIHYNRGWALEALGDLAAARDAYQRAVALDPRHVAALGALANLAQRAGDWTQARALAARTLALDPAWPPAITALAAAEAGLGDAASAERRLRAITDGGAASGHERAVALGVLGDVLDQQGRYVEAFAAYASCGDSLQTLYAGRFSETARSLVERLTVAFGSVDTAAWRRSTKVDDRGGTAGHVFLVGFPRSGTTMLGQALASHPDAVTLDERETLGDGMRAFLANSGEESRLAAIGSEDAERYRQAYWDRVRAAGVEPAGRLFIDKLPMNILALPLIGKLFPAAKVLFLRRDPRDVVFSAFRRRFAIDGTTVELLSLEGAARFYDAVMRLMEIYRRVLDLDLREQSYEAMVGDFEAETRAICAFAGLDWSPKMADFAGRAGDVATPSSSQIARGLNTESVGQWRRYSEQLSPVLPVLQPWVDHFGYPPAGKPGSG